MTKIFIHQRTDGRPPWYRLSAFIDLNVSCGLNFPLSSVLLSVGERINNCPSQPCALSITKYELFPFPKYVEMWRNWDLLVGIIRLIWVVFDVIRWFCVASRKQPKYAPGAILLLRCHAWKRWNGETHTCTCSNHDVGYRSIISYIRSDRCHEHSL